jgi:hypothetical protein
MSFLTTSFILPLLVLLGSVVIDIQHYVSQQVALQDSVDDAALVGTKYLPHIALAEQAATNLIKRRIPDAEARVQVKHDSLVVESSVFFQPFLASFFSGVLDGHSFGLPLKAISYGKITPVDLFLAIERGNRVAPQLSAAEANRFGTQQSFPLPRFFAQHQFTQGPVSIAAPIALEQCFNPRFLKIKQASIRILDSIAGSPLHRLSVSFFPGSRSPRGNNRSLQSFQTPDRATFYDTYLDSDNGTLVTMNELETEQVAGIPMFPVRSVHCALVAQQLQEDPIYALPARPNFISGAPNLLVDEPTLTLNSSYPLTYAEPIWSRVAHPTALFDTRIALSTMMTEFGSTEEATNRGGMINRARQVAVVASVGLPQVQGITLQEEGDAVWSALDATLGDLEAMRRKDARKLTILYVMLEGTPAQAELTERLFQQHEVLGPDGQPRFQTRVFTGEYFDTLLREVLPSLLRGEQGSVLAR